MAVKHPSHLSKALQKYYLQKGNRIIFQNKMTLNQLAITMWERLGFKEIDASVLSRVINGERLFTIKQLEVFCEIVKINWQESYQLKQVLLLDIYERYKLDPSFYDFDFLSKLIEKIHQLRLGGKIDLAVELTEILINAIKPKITQFSTFKQKDLWFFYYSKLMLEKYYNNSVLFSASSLNKNQQFLISETEKLSKVTQDKNFIGLNFFFKGGLFYDKGLYNKALPRVSLALKFIEEPNLKLEVLRQKSLSLANLGLMKRFQKISFPEELIANKETSLSDVLSFKTGWARAVGLFKNPKALDLLEQTEKFYVNKKINDVYRLIQIKRSQMELVRIFYPKDKNLFEKIGKEGLRLTEVYGYKRYKKIIKKLMNKVL